MKEKYRNIIVFAMMGAFLLVFGILFFFLIFRAGYVMSAVSHLIHILMPFIYGMVIAYLLRPICNRYEGWMNRLAKKVKPDLQLNVKVCRLTAIALSFLTAFVILIVLLYSVIPQLTRSLMRLSYAVPSYVAALEQGMGKLFEDNAALASTLGTSVDSIMSAVQDWTRTTLIPGIRNMMGNFSDGIFNVLNVFSNLFIGIIAAVYMLANRSKFMAQGKLLLYALCREDVAKLIEDEIRYTDQMFAGFLGGKIVDSTIIGIICFIGCSIMNTPNALLASVIVGVTNIIPFFGPYIGLVPSALIILISSPVKCVWFVIFILLLQQLDGNVIGPRILGNSTGLSGFSVLFAIIFFGGLFGFVGMIIGVPLFAVISDIIQRSIRHNLRKRGHTELLESYERRFVRNPGEPVKKERKWKARIKKGASAQK